MRIFSFMVVVALGACGSKKEEPPPAPGCEAAVENAIKLSRDAIPDDKTAAKAREVSLTRCNEDKWSAETRDCLVKAKVAGDVAKCGTAVERKKLEEALAAAMMGSDPGPGSDVGSGSGSAGSGSGSGLGSGSAAKGSGSGSGSAVKAGSGSGSATGSGSAGSGSATKPAAGSAAGSGSAAKPAAESATGSAVK